MANAPRALASHRVYFTAGAAAAAALSYVAVVDPHRPGAVYPPCPFKLLTGWNCPACGGLRMTHDLLHANLFAAVNDNVFLLAVIPALLAWIGWRLHRKKPPLTQVTYLVVAGLALVWTVVRNIPGFPLVPTVLSG